MTNILTLFWLTKCTIIYYFEISILWRLVTRSGSKMIVKQEKDKKSVNEWKNEPGMETKGRKDRRVSNRQLLNRKPILFTNSVNSKV